MFPGTDPPPVVAGGAVIDGIGPELTSLKTIQRYRTYKKTHPPRTLL